MVISLNWHEEYKKQVIDLLERGEIHQLDLFGAVSIMSEFIALLPESYVKQIVGARYGEDREAELSSILIANVNAISILSKMAASEAEKLCPKDKQQDEFLDNMKDLIGE